MVKKINETLKHSYVEVIESKHELRWMWSSRKKAAKRLQEVADITAGRVYFEVGVGLSYMWELTGKQCEMPLGKSITNS